MGTLCFMEHRHRDHKIAYNKSLQWKLVLAIKAVSFFMWFQFLFYKLGKEFRAGTGS
jgi:hypothetical protein